MLLPEAIAGVASVLILHRLVRKWAGDTAADLAALAFALTPVAVLMFRYNNPDAFLTFLCLAAAWALWSAVETGRTRWLVVSAALVGLAFNTKMLQAYLVVPAFIVVYLVAGKPRLAKRIGQLAVALVTLIVSSGWWVAVVALWPSSARPYIGSTSDNSILSLVFGYNGLSRIFGGSARPAVPAHRPAAARRLPGVPDGQAAVRPPGLGPATSRGGGGARARWRSRCRWPATRAGVESAHGEFAMTDSTGVFLYSRVMTFADCSRMSPPTDLLPLCTAVPPAQRRSRRRTSGRGQPAAAGAEPMFSPAVDKRAERFAVRPSRHSRSTTRARCGTTPVRTFEWNRAVFPDGQTYDAYRFGPQPLAVPAEPYSGYQSVAAYYVRGNPRPSSAARSPIIVDYQRYVWLPGTSTGSSCSSGCSVTGPAALGRRRGGYGGSSPREILLPWLCSLALVVVPAATAEFDYRYVTTAMPFACLAAAMAFGPAGLTRRGASGGPDGRLADAGHDKRDLTADAT